MDVHSNERWLPIFPKSSTNVIDPFISLTSGNVANARRSSIATGLELDTSAHATPRWCPRETVPLFPCSNGENRLSALHCQVFSTLLHEPQKRYRFLIGVPRVLKSHITVTFTDGLKAVSDKVSYRVQQKNYCVVIVYIPR